MRRRRRTREGLWWRVSFDAGSLLVCVGIATFDWRLGVMAAGAVLAVEGWLGMRGRIR